MASEGAWRERDVDGAVKRFEVNERGRDFVVGDIHGAYEMLLAALSLVEFDESVDRLFSVGDLIDRGPQSARALEFLAQPWFHAIRGNHDDDFSQLSVPELRMLARANWNGLGWALGVDDSTVELIRERLSELPVAIEVATRRGVVGLVHGEVPIGMRWGDFLAAVEAGDPAALQSALWGRERAESGELSGVLGVDRVFAGHTPQWGGPSKLGNVYAIDTGAVFRLLGHGMGSLTLATLTCPAEALAPEGGFEDDAAVRAFVAEGSGPFADGAFDAFAGRASA